MRRKRTFNILLFITILAAAFISCHSDDTCRKSRKVELGINLYLDTINHLNGRLVVQNLTVDSLWVHGIGIDSLLYNNNKNVTNVRLPLNMFEEESRFRMVINSDVDTLTVRYKNEDHFLSLECGYIRVHTIDTVFSTGHFIDSISVVNHSVNTIYVENIQIHHNK